MRCPHCGEADDRVIDSRSVDHEHSVRRRRECHKCGGRFTTYEVYDGLRPIKTPKETVFHVHFYNCKDKTHGIMTSFVHPALLQMEENTIALNWNTIKPGDFYHARQD